MPTDDNDPFCFRSDLTPQANVDAFLDHLSATDQELARLLREHLPKLLEATSDRGRTEARQEIARTLKAAFGMPTRDQGGEDE